MNILNEFITEINEIKKQIDFIESSLIIDCNIPIIKNMLMSIDVLYSKDIQENKDKIFLKIDESIEEIMLYLKDKKIIEINDYYKSLIYSEEFSLSKDKILSFFEMNKTYDEIISELEVDFDALSMAYGSRDTEIDYLRLRCEKEYQYFIISILEDVYSNTYILKKNDDLAALKHFRQILSWLDINNLHNIYRQSFILIMSLFDASYFSLFKQLFVSHFSEVLSCFEDDTFNYSDVSKFNDMLELQNFIIDKQLRKCYLKDLLLISQKYNKNIFYSDSKKYFGKCIELINRRNSHIHNYGKVDKKYLMITKRNPEGQFNIFNKVEGDYLTIDKQYFLDCVDTCKIILSNLSGLV